MQSWNVSRGCRCAPGWALMLMAAVLPAAPAAEAVVLPDPLEVGTGPDRAELYIEFKDGAIFLFDVGFSEQVTGLELLQIVEAETPLELVLEDFGFGQFVDGMRFGGHENIGFGGGEDWWHYWVREPGETDWHSPPFGAADRTVNDGAADGWIYGRAGEPISESAIPEPATALLVGVGATVLLVRRRRDGATGPSRRRAGQGQAGW